MLRCRQIRGTGSSRISFGSVCEASDISAFEEKEMRSNRSAPSLALQQNALRALRGSGIRTFNTVVCVREMEALRVMIRIQKKILLSKPKGKVAWQCRTQSYHAF